MRFPFDPFGLLAELHDKLLVWADQLQAEGDPRGELIALELESGSQAAKRQHDLKVEWLGKELASHPGVRCAYGFLEIDITERDLWVVTSLAGPRRHLISARIKGNAATVEAAVTALSSQIQPWLLALEITSFEKRPARFIVEAALASELVGVTPQLLGLQVWGNRVFEAFPHPGLVRINVTGCDAIGSLMNPALTSLNELDLAFDCGDTPVAGNSLHALPRSELPALRRLDLSRNEPGPVEGGALSHCGGDRSFVRFLRELELVSQLTHLRVPSIRTAADAADLQAVMDRMPHLVELEVARDYGASRTVSHPSAKVTVPPSRRWPPYDRAHGGITVEVPDARIGWRRLWPRRSATPGEYLELRCGVDLMESVYDELSDEGRIAWDQFWEFVNRLGSNARDGAGQAFSVAVLERALEACGDRLFHHPDPDLIRDGVDGWPRIRDALRMRRGRLQSNASVMVRRHVGGWSAGDAT
ncbi:MAG TPA: hypothetical protein VIU61_16520 [Kofleriaceae bacterium]